MASEAEVVRQTKNDGISFHFASLVDLCHLMHAELAKHLQRFKGRVVLLGLLDTKQTSPNTEHQLDRLARQSVWIQFSDFLVWQWKRTQYPRAHECACRQLPDCKEFLKECPRAWIRLPPVEDRNIGIRSRNRWFLCNETYTVISGRIAVGSKL